MMQSACDCRQYRRRTQSHEKRCQIIVRRINHQSAGCSYNSRHGHTGFLLLSLSRSLGKPGLLLSFLGRQLLFAGSDHPFATYSSHLVTPFHFSSNVQVLSDRLSWLSPKPTACRAGRGLLQSKTPPHRRIAAGSCLHASPPHLSTLSWQRGSCCHTRDL